MGRKEKRTHRGDNKGGKKVPKDNSTIILRL